MRQRLFIDPAAVIFYRYKNFIRRRPQFDADGAVLFGKFNGVADQVVPLCGGLSSAVLKDIESTVFCGSKILYLLFLTPSEPAARAAAEKIVRAADFGLFGYESVHSNRTGGVSAAGYARLRNFSECVRCCLPLRAKKDFFFPVRSLGAKPAPLS